MLTPVTVTAAAPSSEVVPSYSIFVTLPLNSSLPKLTPTDFQRVAEAVTMITH